MHLRFRFKPLFCARSTSVAGPSLCWDIKMTNAPGSAFLSFFRRPYPVIYFLSNEVACGDVTFLFPNLLCCWNNLEQICIQSQAATSRHNLHPVRNSALSRPCSCRKFSSFSHVQNIAQRFDLEQKKPHHKAYGKFLFNASHALSV